MGLSVDVVADRRAGCRVVVMVFEHELAEASCGVRRGVEDNRRGRFANAKWFVGEELFVIGGARIYEMCLPRADRLLITRVHAEVEGDVWFPEVDWNDWQLLVEESYEAGEKDDYAHTYQTWQRTL